MWCGMIKIVYLINVISYLYISPSLLLFLRNACENPDVTAYATGENTQTEQSWRLIYPGAKIMASPQGDLCLRFL